MKKNIFGIAVAVFAMLSACERYVPQVESAPETNKEQVILTASIGAETKTFLEQVDNSTFKLRWTDDDGFYVLDRTVDYSKAYDFEDYGAWFDIVSGVGESTAEFVMDGGIFPEKYIAFYGDMWVEEATGGQFLTYISPWQNRFMHKTKEGEEIQGFNDYEYPMIAVGEGTTLTFQNLASVLKLSVTGNGEVLTNVAVESLDENVWLAGEAVLTLDGPRPGMVFTTDDIWEYTPEVYNTINFGPSVSSYNEETYEYETYPAVLSDEPIECYIIIPAQTYPSGLKVTLSTESGYMQFTTDGNLTFSQSELREIPTFEYRNTESYEGKWRIQTSNGISEIMTEENGYQVLKNFNYNYGKDFWFVDGESQEYIAIDEYRNGYMFNTCVPLQSTSVKEYGSMYLNVPGYYDIYLDPENMNFFMMFAGVQITDIPTTDVAICNGYDHLLHSIHDDATIKVFGTVKAKTSEGFLLSIHGYQPVFVHDTNVAVEIGDDLDLCATKTTSRGLPELKDVSWYHMVEWGNDYNEDPQNITDYFDSFGTEYYAYISYFGELEVTNDGHYNIYVDGAYNRIGTILTMPDQQDLLGEYNGQKVLIEGYFAGYSNGSDGRECLNTILKNVKTPNNGGSTEDVIPDDDIVIPTL